MLTDTRLSYVSMGCGEMVIGLRKVDTRGTDACL